MTTIFLTKQNNKIASKTNMIYGCLNAEYSKLNINNEVYQ